MDLVIMAAGIGSRFGAGIKQLTPVGPGGEVILEYSVHDALKAGFDRVVIVTRKELEKTFHEMVGDRLSKLCPVEYAFQELDDLPGGRRCPEGRSKPWGTGQAILACKDLVKGSFAIINADDYYGKEAFTLLHDYLAEHGNKPGAYCMAGFILGNTLSDNGSVTRGICQADENGMLTDVVETHDIVKTADGAAVPGENGALVPVDPKSLVSMNLWGLTPDIFEVLEKGFGEFLDNVKEGDLKSEYLLPTVIDETIKSGKAGVKVLTTNDKWFGVTYAEDKQTVIDAFKALHDAGVYGEPLFGDL